ncbi:hypothetical protein [Glutamicibacter sp. AOP5-A2-18]|uniref:hypothetical protein n=1 Tax=Glutamicibacter sp. AOP5-A2-18 TaxID=3457656 RepID=UPI00403342E5
MTLSTLNRYSKPRGAGDQTSGGRGKLLRPTSDLSRVGIVVRETLQNSWDARDPDWDPAYGVRVYKVKEDARRILRERIFTNLPSSLKDLGSSLNNPNLHAIEIFDRGTSGLNGPYRATEVAEEGGPNNFNSFVFDIGTTKTSESSGGTFGFGKTATFEVSRVHSVVYWTRCLNDEGQYEHRLIAACLHEPYAENQMRYTGAHWWGNLVPSTSNPALTDIVPILGEEAQKLGELLFHLPFGDDGDNHETGTSILILEPVISVEDVLEGELEGEQAPLVQVAVETDDHVSELLKQISEALSMNSWPKTIPLDDDNLPMLIELYRNEDELKVAERIRQESEIYANALIHVRTQQGQQTYEEGRAVPAGILDEKTIPITLRPPKKPGISQMDYFGTRRDRTVGHLHLSLRLKTPLGAPSSQRQNALCLMRSEAELVVYYDDDFLFEDENFEWHGVFKPTPECDKHFSASEPPTHDSWNPRSGTDNEISAYVVTRTLNNIRSKTREFLSVHQSPQKETTRSVREVATGLREFVPFGRVDEMEERNLKGDQRRGQANKASSSVQVEILGSGATNDRRGQQLQVRARSKAGNNVLVKANIFALTAEGRMKLTDEEAEVL